MLKMFRLIENFKDSYSLVIKFSIKFKSICVKSGKTKSASPKIESSPIPTLVIPPIFAA